MSERTPVEPEKKALNPDDDQPDVEGHLYNKALESERAALNPEVDELDPDDRVGPSEKF